MVRQAPFVPCLENECNEYATNHGRCKRHQKPAFALNRRRERLPKDWNSRRDQTFRKYGNMCYVCSKNIATEIDHVQPGDNHALWNLRPICVQCHRSKTGREGAAASNWGRR